MIWAKMLQDWYNRKMEFVEHPQVNRIYAGAILESADGRLALQQRDSNPKIRNSGRITTFGGSSNVGETPGETLVRELAEELNIEVDLVALRAICVVDKVEEDSTPTRCYFFYLRLQEIGRLKISEGEAIVLREPEEFLSERSVTDTCRHAIQQFLLWKTHAGPELAPEGLRLSANVADAAHQVNEDVWSLRGNVVALVDGASPQDPNPKIDDVSDARWLAEFSSNRLVKNARDSDALVDVFKRTLTDVREVLHERRYPADVAPPSAAAALCRVRNGVLEYCVMSDVTIATMTTQGNVFVVEDMLSWAREQYLVELERTKGSAAVREAIVSRRSNFMNRPDGYWVFANDPHAANFARYGFVQIGGSGSVLLASDGFARTVSPFGIATWTELVRASQAQLDADLRSLRAMEREDQSRRQHPRITVMDDATAVLCHVELGD